MRFTALKTFWCDETQSEYVAGLSYQYQTSDDSLLHVLVPKWLEQGLVEEGGGEATMTGTGG
jgi:hypothetical protein